MFSKIVVIKINIIFFYSTVPQIWSAASSIDVMFFTNKLFTLSWLWSPYKLIGDFLNFNFDQSFKKSVICSQWEKQILQLHVSGKGLNLEGNELQFWTGMTYIWGTFDLVFFNVILGPLGALAIFPKMPFSKCFSFYSYDSFSTKLYNLVPCNCAYKVVTS